jgi:hypothetical protein
MATPIRGPASVKSIKSRIIGCDADGRITVEAQRSVAGTTKRRQNCPH